MSQKHTQPRRKFLQAAGAAVVGALAAGCQPNLPATLAVTPTPTTVSTSTAAVVATSAASAPWKPEAQVAIAQQAGYERKAVRAAMEQLLGDLWEWKNVIPAGARVAIKVNLTGGVNAYQLAGVPAVEAVATHPEVVRALGEILVDAGAARLYIVEAVSEWQTYSEWGYEAIAKPLNATLIDLNKPDPYPDFASVPVPNHMIYEAFTLNRILSEVDTFISVSKMKCHIECGVTHTMKNLVGLVPVSVYHTGSGSQPRSAFHEDSKRRLPRIIVDLNMARPIHLAVVDGIKTIEAGEGTWAEGAKQVSPGLLVAGLNALATDTVATALMGLDPNARYPHAPFTNADNYLNLAYTLGLGTNQIEAIDVRGPAIESARYPFQAATGYKH